MNRNKRSRLEVALHRAAKLAVRLGWKDPFPELPLKTQVALLSRGTIRTSSGRNGRKRFGKSSGKRLYGHFSGYSPERHLDPKALRDRGITRDAQTEIEEQIQ